MKQNCARLGKRTQLAAARIALDLVDEGIIDTGAALAHTTKLAKKDLNTLRLASKGDPNTQVKPLDQAMCACPAVFSGEIALDDLCALARAGIAPRSS